MKHRFKVIKVYSDVTRQVVDTVVKLTGRGPMRFRERNCNLESVMVPSFAQGKDVLVHAGESLEMVRVGTRAIRDMERSIRKQCRHSNVIFRDCRVIAREMLEELEIPFHRPRKKLTNANKRKRAGRNGRMRYGL